MPKLSAFPLINPAEVFIIAEVGVNHNGDVSLAKKLVDIAKEAGANAVKFQTFSAKKLTNIHAPKARYQEENDTSALFGTQSQRAMLEKLELSETAFIDIAAYCKKKNITFLSTPFDEDSADFLVSLDVEAFKVSSGDLTALPFLAHMARHQKPMIISTGMADLEETALAVQTISENGNPPLAILHCVSQYPAAARDCNLRAIDTLHAKFGTIVGWSDHTLGQTMSVAAVARGAQILEKHFTLDKNMPGPDHKASLSPVELACYIRAIRDVECGLGNGVKRPCQAEMDTRAVARRSLVVARNLPAGHVLLDSDIIMQRPGTGVAPKHYHAVIGKTLCCEVWAQDLLKVTDLELENETDIL